MKTITKAGNKERKEDEEVDTNQGNVNVDDDCNVDTILLLCPQATGNKRTQAHSREFYQRDEGLEFIFHDIFCDPETGEVMADPVVVPSGNSYERKVAKEKNYSETECYSNHALRRIIEAYANNKKEIQQQQDEECTSNASTLHKGTIDEWISSSKKMNKYKSASATAALALPVACYCPITKKVISHPVIDPEGITYEKDAILRYLQTSKGGLSPITRQPIQSSQLYENLAVQDFIYHQNQKIEEKQWTKKGKCTTILVGSLMVLLIPACLILDTMPYFLPVVMLGIIVTTCVGTWGETDWLWQTIGGTGSEREAYSQRLQNNKYGSA